LLCSAIANANSVTASSPALHSRGPLDEVDFSGAVQLVARLRALAFYTVTVLLSLPLFVSMLVITPFQFAFDKHRRAALHFVNDLWAICSTSLFYDVEVRAVPSVGQCSLSTKIRGAENLPGYNEPVVFVANHQSYLDIYSLFHLRRPFKVPWHKLRVDKRSLTALRSTQFISKTSNFLIPIIGWSMYLTGHVPLKRMDKRSQMECLNACRELLRQRVPVLFFPEARLRAAPCQAAADPPRAGHALRIGQDGRVQERRLLRRCEGGRPRRTHHAGRHWPPDAQRQRALAVSRKGYPHHPQGHSGGQR
jgi:1-acyl-sn-glycerol-3-phosphate acyltransferase